MTYGETIRKKRVELEIRFFQMALAIDKSVVYYCNIERDLQLPTPEEAKIINEKLGL